MGSRVRSLYTRLASLVRLAVCVAAPLCKCGDMDRAIEPPIAAAELAARVCAIYGCPHEPHLIQPKKEATISKKAA